MRKLFVLILVALFLLVPNCAAAQHTARPSPHLILARMCAHEASLPIHIGDRWVHTRHHDIDWGTDCWIIHTALLRIATQIHERRPDLTIQRCYVIAAVNYSHGRILHPPATDTNRWAADLHPDGHRPAGWHGLAWAHMRPSWQHVYEVAGSIIHTPLDVLDGPQSPLQCDGPVSDWGSVADRPGALRRGLIELHCDGHPANIPFRRP